MSDSLPPFRPPSAQQFATVCIRAAEELRKLFAYFNYFGRVVVVCDLLGLHLELRGHAGVCILFDVLNPVHPSGFRIIISSTRPPSPPPPPERVDRPLLLVSAY